MTNEYKHWRIENDADSIFWLYADKAEESTNSLSQEMLLELDTIIDHVESQPAKGLIILSAKKNGFIAGADIKVLAQAKEIDQAAEFIRLGQGIFNRIEKLRFPTIALIHGFCMGGGLELAMACRYRIADDDASTKLGLPEIRLGIHPGFGGVLRLPKLVGGLAAMDLMLSGRAVSARAAQKIGLIDYAVPSRHLHSAAREIAHNPPRKRPLGFLKNATNHALIRPILGLIMGKKVAKRAPGAHYPAPYKLIELWTKYTGDSQKVLQAEEKSLSNLVVGQTAQNLIRVFFLQDQLKNVADKTLFNPTRIHVIGAGVMGADIAAWCALQGMTVTLQDRDEKNIARAIKNAHKLYSKKLKLPRLVQATLDNLVPDMKGLGLPHADVIIEAIFENKQAKHELYRQIEPVIKKEALLATNTSSIPLQELGEALQDPSRLVGIHFFNPVAKMQLVEIVKAENTDTDMLAKANAFTAHIKRLPLPVKSSPGFLVNRVLMPYLVEAVTLESEGISAEVIDKAAMDFGMPMGPITLADTVGLDICKSVVEILSHSMDVDVPQRLKSLVDAGHLGLKSGRGFYTYKNGKVIHKNSGKNEYQPQDIQDRLIMRLLNEAAACIREGVVEGEDLLDAGIIFGTGFAPFRGGPLHYCNQLGKHAIYTRLSELESKYSARFKPDSWWPVTDKQHQTEKQQNNQSDNKQSEANVSHIDDKMDSNSGGLNKIASNDA